MLSPWIIYKLINLAIYLSIKYIPQSNILIIWIWLKKKILCHKKMLSMKNWTSKIKFNKIYQNDRFDLSNRLRTLNTDDPAKSRLTFDSFLSLSRYKLLKVVSTGVQVSFHEKRKKKREREGQDYHDFQTWFLDEGSKTSLYMKMGVVEGFIFLLSSSLGNLQRKRNLRSLARNNKINGNNGSVAPYLADTTT